MVKHYPKLNPLRMCLVVGEIYFIHKFRVQKSICTMKDVLSWNAKKLMM